MPSKLSVFAAKICESSWLAIILVVPILFNPYTERFFEEDKIPLMRSITLIMFLALLVWSLEQRRTVIELGWSGWKIPLVVPTLLLTGAYLVATGFSVEPRVSFWGAYLRLQGTYTWLSYVIIFFAILLFVRNQQQVQRIITVILLTSVPVALYAFLQYNNLDPISWRDDVTDRVMSTIGNPIFISAYLIMVVPLTIMRIIENLKVLLQSDEAKETSHSPTDFASSLLLGAYLFLLIIQFMTIIYSQSRGPLLGLLVGMSFFVFLLSLSINRWLFFTFAGLAVLAILFLVVFNLPNTPLEPLRNVPYLGRFGNIFNTGLDAGGGQARPAIWQGSVALLAADPLRNIVGYGPDALYIVYESYRPPELELLTQDAFIDRAHNEMLDSLITTGVIGFVALLFLFLSLFFYLFKWLALIKTDRQHIAFFALLTIGGLGGTLLPYLIEGSFRFSGVGLPVGITFGLMAYLLIVAVTQFEQISQEQHPQALLLTTLLAAILAHFIEIQFGIAISITRLYFWVYAALVVVIGLSWLGSETTQLELKNIQKPISSVNKRLPTAKRRRKNKAKLASQNRWAQWKSILPSLSSTIILSLMMSLVFMVMTFNFYIPAFRVTMKGYSLIWLFLATWLYGALIVAAESSFEQENRRGWLLRLATYATISLGTWVIFCLIYMPWVQPPAAAGAMISLEDLYALVSRMANAITLLYLFVFLIVIFAAVAGLPFLFSTKNKEAQPIMQAPAWLGGVYAVLFFLVVPLAVTTNLNVSRADTFNKQGMKYENDGQLEAAIQLYKTAVDMQGHEEYYIENAHRVNVHINRLTTEESAEEEVLGPQKQP